MKTITQKINLYNFKELKKDVQEKLIDENMQENYDYYCNNLLYDDMVEKAKDILKKYDINNYYDLKVLYDLSYSQGSGSQVNFKISLKDINDKYKIFSDKDLKEIEENEGFYLDNLIIYIKNSSNYYVHERAFDIDIEDYYFQNNYNYEKLDKLIDILKEDLINLNEELTSIGYDMLENCYAREQALEDLQEHLFLESGDVIRCF